MNYYNTLDSNREDCNINVICSEGDDWRNQINGVLRVSMGGGLCSASLINNTSNDRTPYVLFADHCVSGATSGYVFYFNYQSSTCSGSSGSLSQSVSGSTLLASEDINSGPDFALLTLTSNIPDSYDPFYVGWSRSSLPPQDATGIHHPGADIKKISLTDDNITSGGYFWEFQYNDGRVIPGSSGSLGSSSSNRTTPIDAMGGSNGTTATSSGSGGSPHTASIAASRGDSATPATSQEFFSAESGSQPQAQAAGPGVNLAAGGHLERWEVLPARLLALGAAIGCLTFASSLRARS